MFCNHEVQVPDQALGASARCPKCSSFFTLVPEDKRTTPDFLRLPGRPRRAAPKASPPPLAAAPPPVAGPAAAETGKSTPANQIGEADLILVSDTPAAKPRWIDPFGLGALLAGGAALLCAGVPDLCDFVVPLSSAGLLLGLLGLLLVLAHGKFRLLFPALGTVVAGAILVPALLFPNLLGPVYHASREKDTLDPTAIRVIPLKAGDKRNLPDDPDWVDATRAALQQGRLRIQVLSAALHQIEEEFAEAKNIPRRKYLFIRIRTQQTEAASAVPGKGPAASGPRGQEPLTRLKDSSGKVYRQRVVYEVPAKPNARSSASFPVHFQDEVFLFDAPGAGLKYLRLEVPLKSWGGEGVFRFTIPAAMIRDEGADSPGDR